MDIYFLNRNVALKINHLSCSLSWLFSWWSGSILWLILHFNKALSLHKLFSILVLGLSRSSGLQKFNKSESSASAIIILNNSNIQDFSEFREEVVEVPLFNSIAEV